MAVITSGGIYGETGTILKYFSWLIIHLKLIIICEVHINIQSISQHEEQNVLCLYRELFKNLKMLLK
jgi:hypothetical protein